MRQRRKQRDREATRRAILDAAEQLFAERGFANTAMSRVADRSGVTKSLIHHYFGSKAKLWQEVRERRITEYRRIQAELIAEAGEPGRTAHAIGSSLRTYFEFLRDNPLTVRMMGWTLCERPDDGVGWLIPDLVERAHAQLVELQRHGIVRDDVDPLAVQVHLVALSLGYFLVRHEYERLLGTDPQELDKDYLKYVLKMIDSGLFNKEPRSSGPGD